MQYSDHPLDGRAGHESGPAAPITHRARCDPAGDAEGEYGPAFNAGRPRPHAHRLRDKRRTAQGGARAAGFVLYHRGRRQRARFCARNTSIAGSSKTYEEDERATGCEYLFSRQRRSYGADVVLACAHRRWTYRMGQQPPSVEPADNRPERTALRRSWTAATCGVHQGAAVVPARSRLGVPQGPERR